MTYNIINSNSSGNCIILDDSISLDIGISFNKIKPYLNKIKIIFISHLWLHQDHLNIKTLKKMLYERPTIKVITGSKEVINKLYDNDVLNRNIYYLKENTKYKFGDYQFKIDSLTHDTPNYALHIDKKGFKTLYVVDTSNVDNIEAKDYNLYLIESNYREDILQKHIEECEDEDKLYYLNRVPRTHLSNEQANGFLIENMGENSVYQFIHESSYNYEEREE